MPIFQQNGANIMEKPTKAKLAAAGTIALGVGKIVSGVSMATGHGLMGSYLKKHHMMGYAARVATQNCKSGADKIREGVRLWKEA
jgi:hypothetical protein